MSQFEVELARRVRAERVRFVCMQSTLNVVLSPVGALLVSTGLVGIVPWWKLVVWNAVMVALAFVRWTVLKRFPQGELDDSLVRRWEVALSASIVAVALWWGLGSLALVSGTDLTTRVYLFACVLLITAGTSSTYALHPTIVRLAVLGLFGPMFLSFLFSAEPFHRILGLGGVLYLMGSERGVRLLSRLFVRNQRLGKELEDNYESLRRLEAMRDSLTHMIVHDLRTPLTSLVFYAHYLEESQELSGKGGELVGKIQGLSGVMSEMIDTILDVSRLESDQMPLAYQETGVDQLVSQALERVGPGRSRVVVEGDGASLHCDPDLMTRVLGNFLTNALRFSPEEEPVRVVTRAGSDGLEVSVIDRGPGVPASEQERIFDKFSQAQREHRTTGLGLTFCKLVVERHGGQIGLESAAGKPTRFYFRLPT
ncbi:MAG: HAMP domain-containing histidine kinase [Candidatus Eremiobacteraeota bacterium]|nr:HAMP domain-containing histidine kinase [Candidatus Eremiobacteraeota bacterium]